MKSILSFLTLIIFFSTIQAQYLNLDWGAFVSGVGRDATSSLCSDNQGNVIYTGQFQAIVDFDPKSGLVNKTSNGLSDIFIQKVDSLGNLLWVKTFGGKFHDIGTNITCDDQGNIYVTGYFEDTIDFGGGIQFSTIDRDNFILKLNTNGTVLWVKTITGSTSFELSAQYIKIDNNNDILITGYFNQTVDFDPGPGVTNLTSSPIYDVFILKLDNSGNFKLVKSIKGNNVRNSSAFLDKNNNLYIAGNYSYTADFDPGPGTHIVNNSSFNFFLLKLNSKLEFKWVKNFKYKIAASERSTGTDIKVDGLGNVYMTGIFNDTVDFDPGPNVNILIGNNRISDGFLLKFDSTGTYKWVKQLKAQIHCNPRSMIIDNKNFIYLSGEYSDSVDFDPGVGKLNLYSKKVMIFILKLDQQGNLVWVEEFGNGFIEIKQMVMDVDNKLLLSGRWLSTSIDFDPSSAVYNPGLICCHENGYLIKINEGSCSDLTIVIDSLANVHCNNPGIAKVHATNGEAPYNYNWNTSPVTNDSIVSFYSGGIYTINVNDSKCSKSRTLFIDSPAGTNGFDLQTNIIGNNFRTGLSSNLSIVGFNDWCSPISGMLSLITDDSVSYVFSTNTPDQISGDTLKWNFTDWNYDSTKFMSTIVVKLPTTVSIGDTLCFDALITQISGDNDTTNNKKHRCFQVVNSYDPNIKQVYPQGECEEHYTLKSEVLTYTINFQNTGNANAIDIYLIDSLDQNLDLTTLDVVVSSHNMYTEILEGNVLKFVFDDINLPDSNSNEPESHGYVIFEIKAKDSTLNGTVIENTAHIYFDFNEAIVTNTTHNTLVESIPNCEATIKEYFTSGSSINLYPNPVNDILKIQGVENGLELNVIDITGKAVLSTITANNKVDVSSIKSGIYFLQIISSDRVLTEKFVKQ